MVSAQVKEQTKSAHQSLEKIIIRQIKRIGTIDEYSKLLSMFYGYYAPLEKMLSAFLNDDLIPFYSKRRNAAALAKDLNNSGAETAAVEICDDLPMIDNIASALGVMYVLEGSTLGGVHIAKMLEAQLSLSGNQLTFFKGYGDNNKTMWMAFTEALDGYGKEADKIEIITAAQETFEKFSNWASAVYKNEVSQVAG